MSASPSAWDQLQQRGVHKIKASLQENDRVCAVAPTGFGKTRISQMLIKEWQQNKKSWAFLTHRKLLFSQTHEAFKKAGIFHGCRAAGYEHLQSNSIGQLIMLPSERSALRSKRRQIHKADYVIIDEWHCNKSGFAKQLAMTYSNEIKAKVIGFTATPDEMGGVADSLVVMSTNSELRAVGGIVICDTYAPDEVDMSDVRRMQTGEFNQKQMGQRFMVQQVVDSVIDRWIALNPHGTPTLLFAPGVKESLWFCDQFLQRGIKAAHIDGENIYLGERTKDGEHVIHKSKQGMRDHLAGLSKTGKVQVVCNRFVMREGVDWPWLQHGVWACTLGTEEGWIQSGGRILRAYPGVSKVTIQDHGGNWWRHGSLNADRVWHLHESRVEREKRQKDAQQSGQEQQALTCPGCKRIVQHKQWAIAKSCPFCKYRFTTAVREVIQTSGKLKKVTGAPVKVKRTYAEAQKAWNSVYYPCKNSKRRVSSTFNQAVARFHKQFPRYRITRHGKDTVVVDKYTGRTSPLHNIPMAHDVTSWKKQVREVAPRDLQNI
jgi:superfamily II DNA or RNA helicase